MAKVEEIIERLVAEFKREPGDLPDPGRRIPRVLVQHRRRVEIAERRAAETQRGQEKLEMARSRASAELDRRIGDATLPPAIASSCASLAAPPDLALLREGEEGASVAEALSSATACWRKWPRHAGRLSASHGCRPGSRCWPRCLPASVCTAMRLLVRSTPCMTRCRASPSRGRNCSARCPSCRRSRCRHRRWAESPAVESAGRSDADDFDKRRCDRFRRMEIGNWLDFVDKDGKVQAGKLSWVSSISAPAVRQPSRRALLRGLARRAGGDGAARPPACPC